MKAKRVRSRDMRGLFFRKGGWWIDVQINGKRFREFAGPTESQAKTYRNKLLAWKRDDKNGLPTVKPEGEPVRFDKFSEDYLSLYARQRKKSYARDEFAVARLKAFIGSVSLKDINTEVVDRYRASRAAAGVKVRTVNLELACLRKILYYAVDSHKLPAYPLPTKGLLGKAPEFRPRILEPDEANAIIAVADKDFLRDAIIVFLGTGLRKRELLNLPRADVDFKRGVLTITADRAKNGKARAVPLAPEIADVLEARPGSRYFFENPETGEPVRFIENAWKTAKVKAGIKGRLRIHDLRDTYATRLLRGSDEDGIPGVDIRTVAELIGDTPQVALERYCHTDERVKRSAALKVPALVFGSRHKVHGAPAGDPATASNTVN
jgi:integrase